MNASRTFTELLANWRAGDQKALDTLTPQIYDELKRLARSHMRRERASHTLQATALVNEAYLRLVDADIEWQDRAHFLAVAATQMRRVLVDYANARNRKKRGGNRHRLTLNESIVVSPDNDAVMLEIDDALEKLAEFDERKAQLIELRFFGGLTQEEAAEALGVSLSTVEREFRIARAWMLKALGEPL